MVRGPWVAGEYGAEPGDNGPPQEGWCRTGEVASIDADGLLRISNPVEERALARRPV
jgi:hypothetical protein